MTSLEVALECLRYNPLEEEKDEGTDGDAVLNTYMETPVRTYTPYWVFERSWILRWRRGTR